MTKLIAEKKTARSHIQVFDDGGVALVVRHRPNPLTWRTAHNDSLGRPMTALEFADFNRIPHV